jgi:Flp pilus assembly protein CpaB
MTKYRIRNIALAVGLAGVSALLIGLYLTSYRKHVDKGATLVPALVAARDIPQGTTGEQIASGHYLTNQQVLRRSVLAGEITQPRELAGLTAATTIYQGEQVTTRRFRPVAEEGVFAQFSGNRRAVVIPGDQRQLLVGTLKTSDHVDVVANIHYTLHSKDGDLRRTVARVVLRDLLVLRGPDAPTAGIGAGETSSVMLRLTDIQSQKLLFAMKNGDWTLALRPVTLPQDSPESVETMESILTDGLKLTQLLQLTGGQPKENINGQ